MIGSWHFINFSGFGVFPVSRLLSRVQVWLIISSTIMGIKDAFKKISVEEV